MTEQDYVRVTERVFEEIDEDLLASVESFDDLSDLIDSSDLSNKENIKKALSKKWHERIKNGVYSGLSISEIISSIKLKKLDLEIYEEEKKIEIRRRLIEGRIRHEQEKREIRRQKGLSLTGEDIKRARFRSKKTLMYLYGLSEEEADIVWSRRLSE